MVIVAAQMENVLAGGRVPEVDGAVGIDHLRGLLAVAVIDVDVTVQGGRRTPAVGTEVHRLNRQIVARPDGDGLAGGRVPDAGVADVLVRVDPGAFWRAGGQDETAIGTV